MCTTTELKLQELEYIPEKKRTAVCLLPCLLSSRTFHVSQFSTWNILSLFLSQNAFFIFFGMFTTAAQPIQQLVMARTISKLMYRTVHPEAFCRPHKNTTLETTLLQVISRTSPILRGPKRPACASLSLPGHYYLEAVLDQLARCIIPEPVRKTSASPSTSPAPSITPTVSVTQSPSASPLPERSAEAPQVEETCGDVKCSELGPGVRMYRAVPSGNSIKRQNNGCDRVFWKYNHRCFFV